MVNTTLSAIKPKFLFHASPFPEITLLQPKDHHIRDSKEGPVVFATPYLPYSTCFLNKTDDNWAINDPFYTIISDKQRFYKNNIGGFVYTLSSDTFSYDRDKPMGKIEWISKIAFEPLKTKYYKCSLEAMMKNYVQVYFVSKVLFTEIKHSNNYGLEILKYLKSENQNMNQYVKPLFQNSLLPQKAITIPTLKSNNTETYNWS